MVNGPDDVYVERGGRIERAPDGLFEGEEAVLHLMGWGGGPGGVRYPGRRVQGASRPARIPHMSQFQFCCWVWEVDYAPDWREQGFEHLIRWELGLPTLEPEAWKEPAIVLIPATVPDLIPDAPEARPYASLAVAQSSTFGAVTALWHHTFDVYSAEWRNKDRSVWMGEGDRFIGMTLGDVQRSWWAAHDRRSIPADGSACGPRTAGLLSPSPTVVSGVRLIGRESRNLGLGRDVISQPEYLGLGGDNDADVVLAGTKKLIRYYDVRDRLMKATNLSLSWFQHLRDGGEVRWRPNTIEALTIAAAGEARLVLREEAPFQKPPADDIDALRAVLDLPEPEKRCRACGNLLSGRAEMWCSDACRTRARRQATRSRRRDIL